MLVSSRHPLGCCVFSFPLVSVWLIITLILFYQEVAEKWFHPPLAILFLNAMWPQGQNSFCLWISLPPTVPNPFPKVSILFIPSGEGCCTEATCCHFQSCHADGEHAHGEGGPKGDRNLGHRPAAAPGPESHCPGEPTSPHTLLPETPQLLLPG